MTFERRDLGRGAYVDYMLDFVPDQADVMQQLLGELPLEVETLVMFGRSLQVPRRVGFFGDDGLAYKYSGKVHHPAPWTPTLRALREQLIAATDTPYDTVLVNHYRYGGDGMGRHADDEPELGPRPDDIRIASISLGARRIFRMRPKRGGERIDYELGEGDLLVMGGTTQRDWYHEVPKTKRDVGERLNLTFRCITNPRRPSE